jgi:hypothetical protein
VVYAKAYALKVANTDAERIAFKNLKAEGEAIGMAAPPLHPAWKEMIEAKEEKREVQQQYIEWVCKNTEKNKARRLKAVLEEEEALVRVNELRAEAEVKVDEEEAIRLVHEMLDKEGDNIEKAKANGMKVVMRKRPVARMMCTKRTLSQASSSKGEEVTTGQGKEKKKKVMKAVLVSYSSGSEDDCNEGFQGGDKLSIDKERLMAALKGMGSSGDLWEVWNSKKDSLGGEKAVVRGRF